MCLIIASPTGKRVEKSVLTDAERGNRDGGGLAWLHSGKIHFRKGLDADEIDALLDGEVKDKPWVAHFRIATVGPSCDELTHPFTIDDNVSIETEGSADAVLFHNGGYSNWRQDLLLSIATSGKKIPDGPWSDSRAVAFMLNVYGKYFLNLEQVAGHSRWCVFDAREPKDRIMLWGAWHVWKEFKFSHQGHPVFSSGHGGGRGNFRSAAEESNEEKSNETAAVEVKTDTPKTTDTTSKSTHTEASTKKRRFSVSKKLNPWKSFTNEGLTLKAENEVTASS